MRKSLVGLATAAALALIAVEPAGAAETAEGAWTPHWFVELASAPSAEGTSEATLDAQHRRFKAEAQGVAYRQRFAYRTLFNGVSITASESAISEIRGLDGVTAVYPVQTASLDQTTAAFEPDLSFAITMTGADIAQTRLGYTGRGVHVAMIDSGIDYDHPDLGGCFGPGCRVTTGYDFVGDDYEEEESDPAWQPVPHPDPYPDDCNGHGTHVAGIVGANGAAKGVAPDVTFGAYRVFGCNGAASDDVVLAAMERVYRDGADVLNMSIGETFKSWPGAPVSRAASRLVNKGVVVVASAGNDRIDGLWTTGAPSVGERVISTASVDNVKQLKPAFALSPDNQLIPYGIAAGSAPIPTSGALEIVRTGLVTTPDDACGPLAPGSLEGKAALIRRGTCTFAVKAANAFAAGAGAVVFYNNAGGLEYAPSVSGIPILAVFIGQSDGELINSRLDGGAVNLMWGDAHAPVPNPTGGLLSFFTSMGLAADLSLKPDITAPGGLIRSTWPVEKGSYAMLSGTSMASPHVAGAAALFKQAHPGTKAGDVGSILQNSADPVPWSIAPSSGNIDYVARQGAGMLDVDDAILATTTVAPGKLSLGDSVGSGDPNRTLKIANAAARTVTYSLSKVDALAVAGRNILAEHAEAGPATVAFSRHGQPVTSVTVPAGATRRIDVSIAPNPGLSEGAVYGGYLVLRPDSGDQLLRVPYAGYKGDYQAVPATTPTTRGYPWLARRTGITVEAGSIRPVYTKLEDGAAFTLAPITLTTVPPGPISRAGADTPFVLVHMNNHADRIRLEIFSTRRRASVGDALDARLIPRNPVENGVRPPWSLATAFALDGTVRRGHRREKLPDGEYYLVMTIERALAQRDTPTETWTSPTFRIARSG